MPITHIADTPFYSLMVNKDKNRVYFAIKGLWKKPDDVANYLNDWEKTLRHVKKNFTILTDLTQAKTAFQEVKDLHERAQRLVIAAGLAKTAEVFPSNVAILKIQIDSVSKNTGMTKQVFTNRREAERWLDSEDDCS